MPQTYIIPQAPINTLGVKHCLRLMEIHCKAFYLLCPALLFCLPVLLGWIGYGPLNQLDLVIQRISDASSNQIKVFPNSRSIWLLVMMHCSWRTSMLYVTKAGLLNWYSTGLLLYGSLLSPDIRGFSTSISFHFDPARHYDCWIRCSPVNHIKFQVWLYFGGPVIHHFLKRHAI